MFSKSKRFRSPVTHAPAVGSYDVNAQTKNAGTMIFGKSKRFLQSKENLPGPCDTSVFLDLSTCSGSSFSSNIRSTPRCNSNNRDKINDLERTIDNLKEELNYLREQNLQLTTERVQNQGLSSFSQETQTETIDTDSKLEEMKKELEKLKIVHKCDLENIKANCDLEIARNMAFKSRIEVLERSNQELCNDRDQVEDYNRRLQATKSDLTREHLELSEKLEKKDEELLALEEQLKHSISTAEKEIANRRTEFDAMITKLADMTKKLDIKDKDIVVMKEEVKLSEDKAKKEIESLKGLLDEEVIRRKAHEEKSTVCEENLKNALKTVNSLNRLKEELEKKSQQLEENIVILGQSNQDLSTNHEEEKKQSQELIRRLQREKMELSNTLDLKIVKIKAHEEKYAECIKHYEENISNLTKTAQDLRTTNSDLERKVHDLEEIIHEFSLKEHDGDSLKIYDEEIQKWKMKYEELQEKVEPFKEQLDAFEAEKNFLLSKHSEVQNEVSTLSAQYAKLLGHQNQKQKIHHVLKLKQENIDLKSELFKLREQCEKQKRSIKQQGKVSTVKKKFSPEDAFAPARK